LGIYHFNPDDEALFVERRFGVGYTLNFGRVSAWVIMGSFLLLAAALVLLKLRHIL
jgi:uncharacterized membrane protein